MAPGDETELKLTVTAPAEAGTYLLELDLVQEQTAWFGNRGSPTVRIPVEVGDYLFRDSKSSRRAGSHWRSALINRLNRLPSFQKREQPVIEGKPQFEMHGIPAGEVIKIAQDHDGRVVAMLHDGATGIDWQGYFYFATR
jgi:hypothetical protein